MRIPALAPTLSQATKGQLRKFGIWSKKHTYAPAPGRQLLTAAPPVLPNEQSVFALNDRASVTRRCIQSGPWRTQNTMHDTYLPVSAFVPWVFSTQKRLRELRGTTRLTHLYIICGQGDTRYVQKAIIKDQDGYAHSCRWKLFLEGAAGLRCAAGTVG
jgi:hypothetical protein